jgi:hypothetical protein
VESQDLEVLFVSVVRGLKIALSVVLVGGIAVVAPLARVAQAGLVPTEAVLASGPESAAARARVDAFLQRADVASQLESLGVDATEARQRVALLTDAEVAQIDARLDRLPAGGSFFGVVAGILVLLILILFITDLLGYTDVFSFIRPLPPTPQNGSSS